MFWRFGFHATSAIDGILDRTSFTLQDVLGENDVVQECKAHNRKLVDYLSKPDTITELLNLIITEPPGDEPDPTRKYKFPSIACDVLCTEIYTVCDAIASRQDRLDVLFSILASPPPVNTLLISYATRVIGVLLNKKSHEMVEYLTQHNEILDHVLVHLATSAMGDLLTRFVSIADVRDSVAANEWLLSCNLVPRLVDLLGPSHGQNVHENAASTLINIVATAHAAAGTRPVVLLGQLVRRETLAVLFDHVVSGSHSSMRSSLSVLIELLQRQVDADTLAEQQGRADYTCAPDALPSLVAAGLDRLPPFVSLLRTAELEAMPTSAGPLSPPLGTARLRVLQYLRALLRTKYAAIQKAFIDLDLLTLCIELFFAYPWNNTLHAVVADMVAFALDVAQAPLRVSLFGRSCLHERILDEWAKNVEIMKTPRPKRRGGLGFVLAMSNHIERVAAANQEVRAALGGGECQWAKFVREDLAQANAINERPLAGGPPPKIPPGQAQVEEAFAAAGGTAYVNQPEMTVTTPPADFGDDQETTPVVTKFGGDDEDARGPEFETRTSPYYDPFSSDVADATMDIAKPDDEASWNGSASEGRDSGSWLEEESGDMGSASPSGRGGLWVGDASSEGATDDMATSPTPRLSPPRRPTATLSTSPQGGSALSPPKSPSSTSPPRRRAGDGSPSARAALASPTAATDMDVPPGLGIASVASPPQRVSLLPTGGPAVASPSVAVPGGRRDGRDGSEDDNKSPSPSSSPSKKRAGLGLLITSSPPSGCVLANGLRHVGTPLSDVPSEPVEPVDDGRNAGLDAEDHVDTPHYRTYGFFPPPAPLAVGGTTDSS